MGKRWVADLFSERKLRKRMEEKKRTEEQNKGSQIARRHHRPGKDAACCPTKNKQFSGRITKFPNQILHALQRGSGELQYSLKPLT